MYHLITTQTFWQSFATLSPAQKQSVEVVWEHLKQEPFAPRLRVQMVNRLSSLYGSAIYSVVAEGDVRVLFMLREPREIVSLDVGTSSNYGLCW